MGGGAPGSSAPGWELVGVALGCRRSARAWARTSRRCQAIRTDDRRHAAAEHDHPPGREGGQLRRGQHRDLAHGAACLRWLNHSPAAALDTLGPHWPPPRRPGRPRSQDSDENERSQLDRRARGLGRGDDRGADQLGEVARVV
ncbi:MAG: hypothetical protein ACRDT0_01240 [Pseudonocardiaceae bacterium]